MFLSVESRLAQIVWKPFRNVLACKVHCDCYCILRLSMMWRWAVWLFACLLVACKSGLGLLLLDAWWEVFAGGRYFTLSLLFVSGVSGLTQMECRPFKMQPTRSPQRLWYVWTGDLNTLRKPFSAADYFHHYKRSNIETSRSDTHMGGQHATYVCMRVKHILVVSVMEMSKLDIFVVFLSIVCMLLFCWQQNANLDPMCC